MPNVPLKDGSFTFIADEDEAQKRYNEEWGFAEKPEAVAPVAAPKEPAKAPTATAKPQPKRTVQGINIPGLPDLKQLFEQAKSSAKEGLTTMAAGPFAPAVAQAKAAQKFGETKIPFTEDATVGSELRRIGTEAIRQVPNTYAAVTEFLGRANFATDPMGQMTQAGIAMDKPEYAQEVIKKNQAFLQAVKQTGTDEQGRSLGIKETDTLGEYFSDDSPTVQQYIKPKTAVGQFAATAAASMASDAIIGKLLKAPSASGLTIETADNLKTLLTSKNIKDGIRNTAGFIFKDLFPDFLEGAAFWRPPVPASLEKKMEEVRKGRTVEERELMYQAATAESDTDFNYYNELLKDGAFGAGSLVALKGTLLAIRNTRRYIAEGVEPAKAFDKAVDDAEPVVRQELEPELLQRAENERERRLGELTTQINRKIEENVDNISLLTREGGAAFTRKQNEIGPELLRLNDELGAIPPADTSVEQLRKQLGVSTPEQLVAKREMLAKRLSTYDNAIAKDPDWINKTTGTGKRASKNSTKVRKATEAVERLAELEARLAEQEAINLQRTAKIAEIERVVTEGEGAATGFNNAINDARVLVNAIDQLDVERVGLLESRNSQLFYENRLDEIDRDYSFPGIYGQAYGELKDILNGAEAAIASKNLNADYINSVITRVDELRNRIIEAGGLAPVRPEVPEEFKQLELGLGIEGEITPQDLDPNIPVRPPEPVQTKVPVTQDENGAVVIDTAAQRQRRVVNEPPAEGVEVNFSDNLKAVKKSLEIDQNPTDSEEAFRKISEQQAATQSAIEAQIKKDRENGTNEAGRMLDMLSNTNAGKFTYDLSDQVLIKNEMDRIQRQNLLPEQYAIAVRKLAEFFGTSRAGRKLEILIASQKFGEDITSQLNKIIVPMTAIQETTASLMRSIRDMRSINAGVDVGLTRKEALAIFAERYKIFYQNNQAINSLFYGAGNALRLFGKPGKITEVFSKEFKNEKDINVAFQNLIENLKETGDIEDFTEKMAKEAQEAKAGFNETVGSFLKKFEKGEEVSDAEIDGVERLMEKLRAARGDFGKLKETEMTAGAVLSTIQTGAVLSNPALPGSIVVQGTIAAPARLGAKYTASIWSGWLNRALKKAGAAEADFQNARIARRTIWLMGGYFNQAFDTAFNAFVLNRSISDPMQARRSDLNLAKSGMRREEAILQDLANKTSNNIFFKYLMEKAANNDPMLDRINKARVLGKVFHDYLIPGEAWTYRSNFGKFIGWTTTGIRNVTGLGTKSYYPGGEDVNLTLWSQLSAAADEMQTALWANAEIHAKVIEEVNDKISQGILKAEDKADAIAAGINKEANALYFQPVKAGYDQKTVGYSILDKQSLQFTRAVNQTEQLGGFSAGLSEVLEAARNSDSRVLSFLARDLFPVIHSPLVAVGQAVDLAYGGRIVTATASMGAGLGAKAAKKMMPQQVADKLPPGFKKRIIDFESQYFSDDPVVRNRAQTALALAAALQGLAFMFVNSEDIEITGGLENTYRETAGKVDEDANFKMLLGPVTIPYRYIPYIGETLAFQSTLRDISQFAPGKPMDALVSMAVTGMAAQILDAPGIAGMDKGVKALSAVAQGDTSALERLAAESFAKSSDPFFNLRKRVIESFDPSRPASAVTRLAGSRSYKQQKVSEKSFGFKDAATSLANSGLSVIGLNSEYTTSPLLEALISHFSEDPEFRLASRKAVPYGKPNQVVRASTAPWWNPIQSVLGRFWWGSNDLNDPVNRELVTNLIKPPSKRMFSKFGVTMGDQDLNTFNHYLNTEHEFTIDGKSYVGIYSYLKDVVNDPDYKKYPSVDSPFKIGAFGIFNDADWDRETNIRKRILQSAVDTVVNSAKNTFIMGDLPDQRFKASEELKNLVLQSGN